MHDKRKNLVNSCGGGGCSLRGGGVGERRMITFFGLGGALKRLKKGGWSKDQFEHNVHVIYLKMYLNIKKLSRKRTNK